MPASSTRIDPRDYPGLGVGGLLLLVEMALCMLQDAGRIGWLAVLGAALAILALLLLVVPVVQFKRVGGVARGDIFPNTTVVVDSGLYAVVRHPQFTGAWMLAVAGALYSQRPLVAGLGVAAIVALLVDFRRADARNVEKFGDEYVRYMARVPGWNPIAGLWRLRHRDR